MEMAANCVHFRRAALSLLGATGPRGGGEPLRRKPLHKPREGPTKPLDLGKYPVGPSRGLSREARKSWAQGAALAICESEVCFAARYKAGMRGGSAFIC